MSPHELRPAAMTEVEYDPFAVALTRVVPSTEAQREIWLAAKLSVEASLAYNESVSLRFRGQLDHAALRASLQALVDRHDALRATFGPDGETFCLLESALLAWHEADLTRLDAPARDTALAESLRRAVETPFDLEQGPLFRSELLRLSVDDHVLLLTAHHIICDGWSWWVIVRELAALYAAYKADAASGLPVAASFADYALQLAAQPDRRTLAIDEAYWLARYADAEPTLDLPTDRPRPALRSFASARIDYVFDASLMSAIKRLGAHRGASLFATLIGGLAAVLARIGGHEEVVIGIPAAAQAVDGHENLVGHGVNLLPLRCAVDPAAPFTQLLDASRSTLLDAIDHQQYTFGTLLKKLGTARDPSRLPLVSVLFNIDQALDLEATAFPGLSMTFASTARSYENFELFINAVQEHGQLRLECQYNTGLFDEATVRRWLAAYETLLRAAVERSEAPLGELPLVSPSMRRDLQALQPNPTPFHSKRRLHELFEMQCDSAPDRVAVRCAGCALSYAQLEARANRIAHLLRAEGAHQGALIGIALDRGTDMLAAVLAVLKTGAAYVPLDPGFPIDRLNYIVSDAGLAVLVTQTAHVDRFDLRGRPVLALDRLGAELAALPATQLAADDVATPSKGPESIAYVIYTSGSTGQPKGVEIPHRAVVNFLTSMVKRPGLQADDRLLAVTTLSFDIAVLELFGPLCVGAEVILATREEAADGAALVGLLDVARVTLMQATPATWRLLLQAGWEGRSDFRVLCGGEALSADLAAQLQRRCAELWNLYGPTETTVWSTCCRVEPPPQRICVGAPIDNTTVWVLDGQRGLCPIGVPGEIWIGGAGVALGYRHRPELTAERFIADPFDETPGARLYRTGDRGRWLGDGRLEHLGRVDFQIKLRGFRIEPGEIEAHLLGSPRVAQAMVMVREDVPSDARLTAYVVAAAGRQITETMLRDELRQALPDYMIPQHVVVLDALPLLPNGKIDRTHLPAPMAVTGSEAARVAPRDALEQQIAAAMSSILACVELSVDDDFFERGGHSLLAAQLAARLSRELQISLPLRALFEAPTVAKLAARIRGTGSISAPQRLIPRLPDRQRAPLSLMQQRLWYIEQLHPGRVVYNTPSAHRLRGPMDEAVFEKALRETVRRQPILRTAIEPDDASAFQRIHDDVNVRLLPAEDLSDLPPREREAVLQRRLDALTAEPFDLAVAPLFRTHLFRLDEHEHVFFFMAHHIIWDGWSFDILYEELSHAYEAFSAGRQPSLAPLTVEYSDFSAWQRDWMRGDELQRQLNHWKKRLSGDIEPLALPTDHSRPTRMSGAGATEWIRLSATTAQALRTLGLRAQATPFMVLLAIYAVLLLRLSGQREVIVGTPVRGRDAADLEPVMGFFVNALPLRLQLDANASFLDALRAVRDVVLDAFASPDVPFEHLVQSLKLPRDDSRPAIYQAMFSFQDVRQRRRSWGDLQHEHMPLFQRGSADDVGLWFIEQEQGLLGGLTYNMDIFTAATAARLRGRYEALIDSALADPQQTIAQLTLLPAGESDCLDRWSATSAPLPEQSLHSMFEMQCDRAPQRVAIRYSGRSMTYAELDACANRLARVLRSHGARRGTLVGVALDRSADMVAVLLGVLKAGAGYVPLDPDFPSRRLGEMIDDAGLALLVTEHALAARFAGHTVPIVELDRLGEKLDALPAIRLAVDADMATVGSMAYVIYTSGSTGQPKGVEIPHRAVVNFLTSMIDSPGLRSDDRVVAITTLSFDIAVLELFGPLCVGAEVVLARREEALDGAALGALIAASGVTLMQATPATWRVLLQSGWKGQQGFRALCGGEALTPELAAQLLARCDQVWNLYGPTETTVWSTRWRVQQPERGISIGMPIANTTVRILDTQDQLCPIGVPGEICIGGAGVALGYHDRPQLTAERFTTDPYAVHEARLYRTGDRGRWLSNGTLEHLGRLDFQVKIRGFRIELGEIEAIVRQDVAVSDCVAVAHDVAEHDRRLVLYVASDEDEATLVPRLRDALVARLPGYMQPQHLMALAALPLTPNGKVDRKSLPAPVANADVSPQHGGVSRIADPRQRYLATVWCELIGIDEVQPHDNFLDVGGHSLLAVEMAARVRRETGVRLNLLEIATGTLASLAMELPISADAPTSSGRSMGSRLRRLLGLR